MVRSQLYSMSLTKKQGLNNVIVVLRRDEKWYAQTNKYSCKRKKEKRCSGFCGKFRISIFNKTLTNSRSGSGWCARTVLQRLKLHVYSFEEHKLGWSLLAQTMICFLAEYRFEGGEIILFHTVSLVQISLLYSLKITIIYPRRLVHCTPSQLFRHIRRKKSFNNSSCLWVWNHLHFCKYHRTPSALIAWQWFDGLIQLVKFLNNKP